MSVFLLPEFIVDLQTHKGAHFAQRALKKTLRSDGSFQLVSNDHRYEGIDNAWIRYISGGSTAYRVIYLRYGEKVYLYRAGEHHIEDHLVRPRESSMSSAIPVCEGEEKFGDLITINQTQEIDTTTVTKPVNRFRKNVPKKQIYNDIFSRRNLPHRDIWLIAPFINEELFRPTAAFGKLLLTQVEDGANVVVITAVPRNKNIKWMERLAERDIEFYVYPRLHAKLYCFFFDENRRNNIGMFGVDHYSSLILVGSANLTSAGIGVDTEYPNEELCYSVPEEEACHVENYGLELMTRGYDLIELRRYLARGQWQKLEKEKW